MYSALHVRSTYDDAFGSVFRQSSRDGTKWPIPALWPAAGVLEDWKHPFFARRQNNLRPSAALEEKSAEMQAEFIPIMEKQESRFV
jgi:hypothetical protein